MALWSSILSSDMSSSNNVYLDVLCIEIIDIFPRVWTIMELWNREILKFNFNFGWLRSHWVDPHSMGLEEDEVTQQKPSCQTHCIPIQEKLGRLIHKLSNVFYYFLHELNILVMNSD